LTPIFKTMKDMKSMKGRRGAQGGNRRNLRLLNCSAAAGMLETPFLRSHPPLSSRPIGRAISVRQIRFFGLLFFIFSFQVPL